ncbi:uncharacterized protein TNCT_473451 [Trichonephila clavata]|uniref:Uncharacterized protein n=1 Tax=Trichonephila clavata TaxID=2740835 RepID=A0A8X6I1C2_TRICU|nr:uncharacterized protein TNCT_473451 [Trichonephila clavata]
MNKVICLVVLLGLLCVASAQWLASGGVKDYAGNYYDFTTGQVASSATGKVYNTGAWPLPYARAVVWYRRGNSESYVNPNGVFEDDEETSKNLEM